VRLKYELTHPQKHGGNIKEELFMMHRDYQSQNNDGKNVLA
jgi:hypothetical protein